ncbi:MAG: hypothetical protein M1821_003601 [Bathelium mastoideum]|nr:MAG: hypothetical protein M1821_003601 [Bathelium mastoideum]KAI9684889.1 MAG: hypothetical protein M1822_005538 [Bathelium mastoideum]
MGALRGKGRLRAIGEHVGYIYAKPQTLTLENHSYQTDSWTNISRSILSALSRRLHLQPSHPISLTRRLIESRFPTFAHHNTFSPLVSVQKNFDSLGFPPDHPGRNRSDTYYVNRDTVLRTHTSAHQADVFRQDASDGWLISADVYRRDAIDRSHYPIFHQMEGARTWDRRRLPSSSSSSTGSLAQAVWSDAARLPTNDAVKVEDPNPPFHTERNPLQAEHHSPEEVAAIGAHLKRSLEDMVVAVFAQAKWAALRAKSDAAVTAGGQEPLRARWVEAYFPFTSPSWELEVFWQGDWLEVLACGIVKQDLLIQAGVPQRVGWAFGIGLERIAMLLFGIPDIRLFWSQDPRFLNQFKGDVGEAGDGETSEEGRIVTFQPFSKYPASPRDVSFFLPSTSSPAGGRPVFHENDMMELVRDTAGDSVEDVQLADEFMHPKTGRKSLCYRINYRSLERTLGREEVNDMHEGIRRKLVAGWGVELR